MAASVMDSLRAFAKQPGCERYAGDGEKVRLLNYYLWLRQLTDGLTFERFLEKFQPLADFDELNRKAPEDAVHYYCPRSKKQATEQNMPQWSAAEVVDFLTLYVDMVREAEAQNTPVPMSFTDFCRDMTGPYKQGLLSAPEPAAPAQAAAPAEKKRTKKAATAPGQQSLPGMEAAAVAPPATLVNGARAMYSLNGGARQFRGKVVSDPMAENGRSYVDFQTDAGELFRGVNAGHVTLLTETEAPWPAPPAAPVKGEVTLRVPKAQYPQILAALQLTTPMGNVALGDPIYPLAVAFQDGLGASVAVINGETGPYVDAQLVQQSNGEVLADLPPRKAIEGDYTFVLDDGSGAYRLHVVVPN